MAQNVVIPDTLWTVRVEVANTYGFSPTFNTQIGGPGIFGTSRATLANNETSTPVRRDPGTDWPVTLTGLGAGVDYAWVCTGDVSGSQTGTGSSITPDAVPGDTVMNCVVSVTDPTPTTITVVSEFSDSPATAVGYEIDYGDRNRTSGDVADVSLASGQSATFAVWSGEGLVIRSADSPGSLLTDISCATGGVTFTTSWFFPRRFTEIAGFRMADGANVTCTISHAFPPSLTVVEDVVPDGLGASASSYLATPSNPIESGPTMFDLADGETQSLGLTPGRLVRLSRGSPIEITVASPTCVRLLAGGATEPYSPERAADNALEVTLAADDDIVCTFTSQQSPPPTLRVDNETLAIDPTIYDSFTVVVTDALGALIDTYPVAVGGSTAQLGLPSDGDYTLTVTNPQGLTIQWGCGSSASGGLPPVGGSPATTITTTFGQSATCGFEAIEDLAAGTASLTIDVDVVPDSTIRTVVNVAIGGRPVFSSEPLFSPDTAMGFPGDGSVSGSGLPEDDYLVTITIPSSHEVTSFGCGVPSALVSSEVVYEDGVVRGRTYMYTVAVPDASAVVCSVVEEPAAPGAFLAIINDITPDTGVQFTYEITPAARVLSGPTSFALGNLGARALAIQADQTLTITQTGPAGYTSSVECYDLFFNLFASGTTSVTFTSIADDSYECYFVNEPMAPSISVRTETVPAVPLDFDYSVTPTGGITSANDTFAQANGASTDVDLDVGAVFDPEGFFGSDPYLGPNVPTVSQAASPLYSTSSGCYDPSVATEPVFADGRVVAPDPGPGQNLVCVFRNTLRPAAATIIVNTVEQTATPVGSFEYVAGPASGIAAGPTSFIQADAASQSLTVDVGTPITVTQLGASGYTTSAACVSDAGGSTVVEPRSVEVTAASAGETITCTFTNAPLAPFDLTLDVVVDTGVIDMSTGFDFLTDVSGPGVDGAATPGTSRTFDLGDGGSAVVAVAAGTDVRIAEVDDLAGPDLFRTTIDCGVAAPPVTNAASTFTITADTTCTVTYAARTLTVEKTLIAFVTGGFDIFDFAVQPALDGSGDFSLSDGDQAIAVVPLGESIELEELDAGPYGTDIECTVQTSTGPTRPTTGPFELGTSIEITDVAQSYFCEVFNVDPGPPVHEVIISSVIDLGGIATPPDLPGFFIDLDGDFEVVDGSPQGSAADFARFAAAGSGPGSNSLEMVSTRARFAAGRSEFLNPNGTLSVFVADGSDLVIGAGAGSDRFANSFSCGGGSVSGDGSVTLTNIMSTVRCDLTSASGVLQVEHVVNGDTTVTDWPFSITEVIAGDSSVSLGASSRSLSAVPASQPLVVSLDDARGAQSVSRSCRDAAGLPLRFGRGMSGGATMFAVGATSIAVSVPGGDVWRCTFTLTYPAVTAPTTTTTTIVSPTTTSTTVVPTAPTTTSTTVVPTAPTTTTTTPSVDSTTTTTPALPFSPASPVTTTVSVTVTTPTTAPPVTTPSDDPAPTSPPAGDTTATSAPPTTSIAPETTSTEPPSGSDAPPSTVPPATPDPVITETDVPEDIYVDIGDPIPVDVDCDGELVITVNGERQDRVDQIEPSTLGLGDHVINVACDGEQVTSVRAVVFEQEESSPAGRNMTVIVMFVVMASAGFLFAPSAAGRKRLAA